MTSDVYEDIKPKKIKAVTMEDGTEMVSPTPTRTPLAAPRSPSQPLAAPLAPLLQIVRLP